jgi:DnaJ-class molecular chaperone
VFTLQQQPHDRFARVGDHLFTRHEVDLMDSSRGYVNIRHLDGRILRVQHKNTVPTVKCVDNEGMPLYQSDSQRGHLYISLAKIGQKAENRENAFVQQSSNVDAKVRDVSHTELSSLDLPAFFLSNSL